MDVLEISTKHAKIIVIFITCLFSLSFILHFNKASKPIRSTPPLLFNNNSNNIHHRTPIRILSLGGSITYGANIESRSLAYPHQIIPPSSSLPTSPSSQKTSKIAAISISKNLAVRATGSEYAAECIQSMIYEYDQLHDNHDNDMYGEKDFDVITLEYSLNGLERLIVLVKRLRQRYPNALFIYIHLWSPRMMINHEITQKLLSNDQNLSFKELDQKLKEVLSDKNIEWKWNEFELQLANKIRAKTAEIIESVGGISWAFPLEDNPNPEALKYLFSSDFHHLNEHGHKLVGDAIRDILIKKSIIDEAGWLKPNSENKISVGPSYGTWGKGDQCYSWYETGQSPLEHKGGNMKRFIKPDKYAHEISIGNGVSSISFENKSLWPIPLKLIYMIWTEDKYPKAKITIQNNNGGKEVSSSMVLNPIHPNGKMRMWHIAFMTEVGIAHPGFNTLTIECIEKKVKPFRLVGISMCGACEDIVGGV